MKHIKDIMSSVIEDIRQQQEVRAIETRYANRLFRSRLEVRWAVFFDALNIKWDYEREGYELNGIRYLPDFWMPDMYLRSKDCKGFWVEIKPTVEAMKESEHKFFILEKPVVVFVGPPPGYDDKHTLEGGFEYRNENNGGYTDDSMRVNYCELCGVNFVCHWSQTSCPMCETCTHFRDWFYDEVEQALSSRF